MGWKLKPNKFWFRMSSSHLVVWQLFCAFPWGLWLLGPFAGAPPSQLLDDVWHCLTTAGFGVFFCCGFSFFGLVYGSRFFSRKPLEHMKNLSLRTRAFLTKNWLPKKLRQKCGLLKWFRHRFPGMMVPGRLISGTRTAKDYIGEPHMVGSSSKKSPALFFGIKGSW